MNSAQQVYDKVREKKSEVAAAVAGSYVGGGFIDQRLTEGDMIDMPSPPVEEISEATGLDIGPDKVSHFGFSGAAAKGLMMMSDKAGLSPSQQFALVNAATIAGGSAFEMKFSKTYSMPDMYANLIGANTAYLQHNGKELADRITSGAAEIRDELKDGEVTSVDSTGINSPGENAQDEVLYESDIESYLREDAVEKEDIQSIIDEVSDELSNRGEVIYFADRLTEEYGGEIKPSQKRTEYSEDLQNIVEDVFSRENIDKQEKTREALTAAFTWYESQYSEEKLDINEGRNKSEATKKIHDEVDVVETEETFSPYSFESGSQTTLSSSQ